MAGKAPDGWATMTDVMWSFTGKFVAAALDKTEVKSGDLVLDVAAGSGTSSLPLAKRCKEQSLAVKVLSTDFSESMVTKCKENAETFQVSDVVECKVMDAMNLQVEDASVDVAMCMFGVFLVPEPPKALNEIARVLKPGGQFVSTWWRRVPTITILPPILEKNGLDVSIVKPMEDMVFKYKTPEQFKELFESYGFTDVSVDSVVLDFPTHLMASDPKMLLANPVLKDAFSGVSPESIASYITELMENRSEEFTTAESWIISVKKQ